ncbi:UNVERIFIED_CONTAM: hypothetical protein GTU68_048421 [Idotea baltica]|nr:hypothetical protein [Idotea baltica]
MTQFRYLKDPAGIYAESFRIVRDEARLERFEPGMQKMVIRLIHSCGMIEIADRLAFSQDAFSKGEAALKAGAPILCDCEMVGAGIIRRNLPAQNPVIVTLNDATVPDSAKTLGTTRSAAAVELWRDHLDGAVVAIGNAPTALFHLWRCSPRRSKTCRHTGPFRWAFVGCRRKFKAALAADPQGCPFVALRGRRGGSAIASAAVNALAAGLPEERT